MCVYVHIMCMVFQPSFFIRRYLHPVGYCWAQPGLRNLWHRFPSVGRCSADVRRPAFVTLGAFGTEVTSRNSEVGKHGHGNTAKTQ